MTHKQIEKHKNELIRIANMPHDQEKKKQLRALRLQIGAACATEHKRGDDLTVAEEINQCHIALQTATMIDMCRTASKNCWIALVSALVALVSAAAAWTAVYMGILEKLAKSPF